MRILTAEKERIISSGWLKGQTLRMWNSLVMQSRLHNLVCLFVAVAVLVQAVVPMAALADVSVRCAGASASAKPCVHEVMFAASQKSMAARFSAMPCCRNMAMCHMSSCMKRSTLSPTARGHLTFASSPKCIVTIKPISATNSSLSSAKYRWLYRSTPSLAPPAAPAIAEHPASVSFPLHYSPPDLAPQYSTHSHGLRAPPCS